MAQHNTTQHNTTKHTYRRQVELVKQQEWVQVAELHHNSENELDERQHHHTQQQPTHPSTANGPLDSDTNAFRLRAVFDLLFDSLWSGKEAHNTKGTHKQVKTGPQVYGTHTKHTSHTQHCSGPCSSVHSGFTTAQSSNTVTQTCSGATKETNKHRMHRVGPTAPVMPSLRPARWAQRRRQPLFLKSAKRVCEEEIRR